MRPDLHDVVALALALPRAERAALLGRLRESLDQPDVPGGIVVEPRDLVEPGARYVFPGNGRYQRETVTLRAEPGPTLSMTWGAVAVADPWLPEAAPTVPALSLGAGDHPTAVTTITRTRSGTGATEVWPVAATLGHVTDVAAWHPLAAEGQFHLDSDSSLGAFYEITDASALLPLFGDDRSVQRLFERALTGSVVPVEVDGRTLAVVFRCGKDLHPAWAGYDEHGAAVAVLLDLGVLSGAQGREGAAAH